MSALPLIGDKSLEQQARDLIDTIRTDGDRSEELGPPRENDIVISPSQYDKWARCPLQWFFYKVEKLPREPSENLLIGQATHAILEAYNVGKTFEELFPEGYALDIARGKCRELGDGANAAATVAYELAHNYLEVNPRRLDKPEEDITCYLFTLPGDGRRVYLRGITDGRVVHPIRARSVLVDYKTSGKRWNRGKAEKETQPDFYALRELVTTGETETNLVFEILLKRPTKCPQCKGKEVDGCGYLGENGESCVKGYIPFQRIEVGKGLADIRRALMRILQFVETAHFLPLERRYFPACPGLNAMNCGWCDFKDECWLSGEGTA